MPGGNGTGPQGLGPMTGRAAGFCAGFSAPGYHNPAGSGFVRGFGCGKGGGRGGRGRGFRNMCFATGLPGWARFGGVGTAGATDEKQVLASQADALRVQLDGIQKRLEQLDGGAASES